MGWLPASVLLMLGILGLALLSLGTLSALRRTRGAARNFSTAVIGRSSRLRASAAEMAAWRAARRGGSEKDPGA